MKCPKCQTENPENLKFCGEYGANQRRSAPIAILQTLLNSNSVVSAVTNQNDGEDPVEILSDCTEAMETVGKRFEAGEYFLPEQMMAGEMMNQISGLVKPRLKGQVTSKKG